MKELEQDVGHSAGSLGTSVEFHDMPALAALVDHLHARKQDPRAPDPDHRLIKDLDLLRGKLTKMTDYHTLVTKRVTTGPGTKKCPCCGRAY